ncbi:M56 family metallopeptidase [Chitinophaga alhagiae]|uniref:M56 family metallopeptidase n=1 Tax=Chitinophaga alhagiae TaxID=2203219 RepID=UPI000E5BCDDA|nr:M56 family metallopeptidase [Chitinophaga alhagiae]
MTSLLPLTTDLIRAFGWTLLHSFWQGFCIYACLRIVLKIWPMASSAIKYHLSCLSLAGIAGWFGATFFRQLSIIKEEQQVRALATQMDAATIQAALQQVPQQHADGLQTVMPGMEAYFPFLVAIYAAGVVIMTIKLSFDLSQLRQLRRQGVSSPGMEWERYVKVLAQRMGIARRVQLFISRHLQVPVMIGFLRPVILLPAAMVNNLSPEQLEAILLHELAHIKRNDYLLNIFQTIVETILFFNPFVWWISKNIRLEREHCCDDLVIAGTVQPLHYARALVALEEYRLTVNPMAMAAADDKHHLFHRIKRIMEMKTKNLNYSQRLLALLIIVTGLVSIAWLNPGKSEKKENCEENKPGAVACDTIPLPPAAPAPAIAVVQPAAPSDMPEPPAAPAPVPAPLPAPAPVAAPGGWVPALPPTPPTPLAPLAPMTPATPPAYLPPMAPLPPLDTVPRKIVIKDDKGTRTYNNLEEMTPEDREKYLRLQEKKQALNQLSAKMKVAQDAVKDIDWSKMNKNIQESMQNIDWNKMNKNIQESMQNIDWSKMNADMREANKKMADRMKDIDWEKISADVNNSIKNIQWDKISDQIKNSLQKTDWEKIEKEIKDKIDKIDWKKIEEDIKNNPSAWQDAAHREQALAAAREGRAQALRASQQALRESQRARQEAERQGQEARREAEKQHRIAIEKARKQADQAQREAREQHRIALAQAEKAQRDAREQAREAAGEARQRAEEHQQIAREHAARAREQARETRSYNELLDKLEADQLIDRNNFEINKKGDELYINGQKQSDDVKKKYQQYLKNENVSIKGSRNNLNVHAQDNR